MGRKLAAIAASCVLLTRQAAAGEPAGYRAGLPIFALAAQPPRTEERHVERDAFLELLGIAIRSLPESQPSLRDMSRMFGVAWRQLRLKTAWLPREERLVIVGPDRRIRVILHGDRNHVAVHRGLHPQLSETGAGLVLIHNHPDSASLSGADLTLLGWPGVAVVVAVGHDGSVYVAARGPAYRAPDFENRVYLAARQQFMRELRLRPMGLDADLIATNFPHLIALVLKNAKVIEYEATLSLQRGQTLEDWRVVLERIAADASIDLVPKES